MKTIFRLFLLFCLSPILELKANPEGVSEIYLSMGIDSPAESNLSDTEGLPSCVVGNVNVITGNYCDSDVDMLIEGPEPLIIQRNYAGSYKKYLEDWKFGHDSLHQINFRSENYTYNSRINALIATERHPSIEERDIPGEKQKDDPPQHVYTRQIYENEIVEYGSIKLIIEYQKPLLGSFLKSWTNCSSLISGKTNLKNFHKPSTLAHVFKDGSGTLYSFDSNHLTKISRSNGNGIVFETETQFTKGQHFNYVTKLESVNFHGIPRAHISIEGEKRLKTRFNELQPKDLTILARGSNGQNVHYIYNKNNQNKIYLSQVIRPTSPNIVYEQLTNGFRKFYPEGRYTEVTGDEEKVKIIKAPLGTDNEPKQMYRFSYAKNVTGVFDANGALTNYIYNDDQRLTEIVRHVPDQIYPIEKFYWADASTPMVGNLLTRSIVDPTGKAHIARRYHYDDFGNVTKEELYGNLSGKNKIELQCNSQGVPQYNGCEIFAKESIYSHDGLNNKIREGDGRKIVEYGYCPGTDLLTSQFLLSKHGIEQRHFFGYDEDGMLAIEVIDDGKNATFMDLTGASQCTIKRIRNRSVAPFGLPEEISEFYIDFTTGQEVLLNKVICSYSQEGWLLRKNFYDANAQFVYFTDYVYDEKGNLIQETNPLGQVIQRRYDGNQNLIYEQGPSHEFYKVYVYDFCNRLIREDIIKADGACFSISHKYDLLGKKIATTDIYGNETQFDYDMLGRLVHVTYPAQKTANSIIQPMERYAYDVLGNVVFHQDACGNITQKEFTVRGKPCKVLHADGSEEHFEYTLDGYLAKAIAKNQSYALFTYDYQGRLLTKALYDAEGKFLSQTSAEYNAFHLLKETDAAGFETHYHYDFAGRVKSITKGDQKTEIIYDSLGRLATQIDWINSIEKSIKRIQYDHLNRVLEQSTEDQDGKLLQLVKYGYDERGNRTHTWQYVKDEIVLSQVSYDCFGQPQKITDPEGNETHIIQNYACWNDLQQRVACSIMIDALGQQTIQTKDALGHPALIQKKNLQNEEIQRTEYEYDLNGNLKTSRFTVIKDQKPQRHVIHQYQYDSLNRPTDVFEAWGEPEQKHTQTIYNLYGFKTAIVKPNGLRLEHHYDALGKLIDFESSDGTIHYQYRYNLTDQVVEAKDVLTGRSTHKSYDSHQRLIEEKLANDLTMKYAFDQLGRVTLAHLANGKQITYSYDAAFLKKVECEGLTHTYDTYDLSGHLLEMQMMASSQKTHFDYTPSGRTRLIDSPSWKEEILKYSPTGQILQLTKTVDGKNSTEDFIYDALYQLCSEKGSTSSSQYEYDSLGNRTSKNGTPYVLNSLNQILSDNEQTYKYDLNGNLIEQGDYKYTYDALDRLVKVEKANQRFEYSYDETNRRIEKRQLRFASGQWQEENHFTYMYQGQNEVGSLDHQSGVWDWRILGKGKGSEIGASIYMELGGKSYLPFHDHIGNICCLTNMQGDVVESYDLNAFGEEKQQAWINPWRFASKRHDLETGFVFFGFRYYFPKLGRWISADPAGFVDGPNLYAYVLNNPVSHLDLFGLESECPGLYDRDADRDRAADRYEKSSNGTFSEKNWTCKADREGNREGGSHKSVFNAVWTGAKKIVNAMGNILYQASTHCLPVGPWRNILRKVAASLSSDPGRNLHEDSSCSAWLGVIATFSFITNCCVVSNGAMNNRDDAIAMAVQVHRVLTTDSICLAHNSTKGFANDLLEAFLQHLGVYTHSMEVFIQSVIRAYNQDPQKAVIVIVHSQGGLIAYACAKYLPAKIKAQMHVYTFGTAKLIPNGMYGKVQNFISKSDAVTLISDPFNYIKAAMGKGDFNVTFLDSKEWFGFEHSFACPTYQKALAEVGRSYIK